MITTEYFIPVYLGYKYKGLIMGRRMVEYEREQKSAEDRKRLETTIAQESAQTAMSAYAKATGKDMSTPDVKGEFTDAGWSRSPFHDMKVEARQGATGSLSSAEDFRGIDNYWTNKLGEHHASMMKPPSEAPAPAPEADPYIGNKPGMDATEPAAEPIKSSDALLRAKAYINKTSPSLYKYD